MNFWQATAQPEDKATFEDQADQDYICEDAGFAIYVSGHYSVEELEQKLRQLKEANRHHSEKACRDNY
jgi:hypothetical protein